MNKPKHNFKKKLNAIYVFSEDNQVYLKKNTLTKNDTISNEEWLPVNFQWGSPIG
ncbi:hypothetical protein [Aquimarina sediminis]|uniref:hypothetical protein n=1 Tax=Aquimarina sediminis TaxID=2070536 RepID=UPI0013E8BA02|nr:hypothetical protein [Aquimarina sediminis]